MFRNYLKTAWRNLIRNRTYSIISIGGLAVGLATSLLIFLSINAELSYDRSWKDADQIYRLNAKIQTGEHSYDTWTTVPAPIGALARRDFAEVENFVRIKSRQLPVGTDQTTLWEKRPAFTEPSFFSMFHITFLEGNASTALKDVSNVVLSRDAAIKYFGSVKKAEGKVLKIGENRDSYNVSAIMENMPVNSTVRFDMLLSLDVERKNFPGNGGWKTIDEDWGDFYYNTFLKLKDGTNLTSLQKKLNLAHAKNDADTKSSYVLQPLTMLRLYNPDLSPSGIKVVKIFFLIAILILVISVINYVNFSTARAMKRAKEVGLRRVIGADRKQLLIQFIIEFVLIFCFGLLFALMLLVAILPAYQGFTGQTDTVEFWQLLSVKTIFWVAVSTIVLASIYPAWILSSFKPGEVLKSGFTKGPKGGILRKTLVLIQFSFSITLIICTIIVSRQLNYIQKKNMGFNRENVFVAPISAAVGHKQDAIIDELRTVKGISSVSLASDNLLGFFSSTDNIEWPKKNIEGGQISPLNVAANFTDLMHMKFVEGSGFTGTPADSNYYLVNEAAIKMMGLKNPIGTNISLQGHEGQIKGVLKDFNNSSLKVKVQPTIFRIIPRGAKSFVLYVKTRSESAKEAVAATEGILRSFDGEYPFEYQFMDETFDAMYRKEIQTAALFKYFAIIAVLLSCSGLFGLSVFTAERRTKEIGVRKVLGASAASISILVSKEFTSLVILANIIAWPVSWYFMNKWIEDFAYHITISLWIFVIAGLAAFVTALLTVCWQAVKVALINPAKSLRLE